MSVNKYSFFDLKSFPLKNIEIIAKKHISKVKRSSSAALMTLLMIKASQLKCTLNLHVLFVQFFIFFPKYFENQKYFYVFFSFLL